MYEWLNNIMVYFGKRSFLKNGLDSAVTANQFIKIHNSYPIRFFCLSFSSIISSILFRSSSSNTFATTCKMHAVLRGHISLRTMALINVCQQIQYSSTGRSNRFSAICFETLQQLKIFFVFLTFFWKVRQHASHPKPLLRP